MDLSTIAPSTVPLEIRNPGTGKATGLVLNLLSMESDAVKKVKRANTNKAINRRNRKLTADDLEENSLDLLVATVASWEWKGDAAWTGGKKPECKPEIVREVLSLSWIRSQVEEVINDESAFFAS